MSARAAKNDSAKRGATVNERVMKEIRTAYVGENPEAKEKDPNCFVEVAKWLKVLTEKETSTGVTNKHFGADAAGLNKIVAPPERIMVMLVGNHSAGKSSFINWYIQDHVQQEAEAIETNNVTIVRRGARRDFYLGPMTFAAYPHLAHLKNIEGLEANITTQICCSNEKLFSVVDFVDTPGLTDGTMEYPFDVEQVIKGLSDEAHIILVFLDPRGQATVNKTMDVVRMLSEHHHEKLRFLLSRFDTVTDEHDRTTVSTQCMQELSKNLKNTHGLKAPLPIYLPERRTPHCGPNKINEVCEDIGRVVNARIQMALDTQVKDCDTVTKVIDNILTHEGNKKAHGRKALVWKVILTNFALVLVALALIWGAMAVVPQLKKNCLDQGDGKSLGTPLESYVCPFVVVMASADATIVGAFMGVYAIALSIGFFTKTKSAQTLGSNELGRLRKCRQNMQVIKNKQEDLVKLFMKQTE